MNETSPNRPAQGGSVILRPDIQRLSGQFIRLAEKTENRQQLILDFLQLSIGLINAAGAIFYRNDGEAPVAEGKLLSRQALSWSGSLPSLLEDSAKDALSSGSAQYGRLAEFPAAQIISCPTGERGHFSGCLSLVVLTAEQPIESFLAISQLLSALLSFLLRNDKPIEPPSHNTLQQIAAITAHVLETGNQQEALVQLNTQLRNWAASDQVALGIATASGRIVLSSLSHVTSVDQRTEQSRTLTKALTECTIQKEMLCYPAADDPAVHSSPILKDLLNFSENNQVVAVPFGDTKGNVIGAALFFWATAGDRTYILKSLDTGKHLLAACLNAIQDKSSFRIASSIRDQRQHKRSQLKTLLLSIGFVLLLGAISFIPVPFRLSTDCLVQPISIRFIVSRFDGILQDVLVQPGDEVQDGDVLARLDGRDNELDQAALAAERNKARKTRDHHLASGNTAAAQIAGLEEQRLEQQLSLLQEKQKHLTLSSPIDGIILTGDMKRIEGSPVGRGQTLFEVSPLKAMIVELAVREDHISFVDPGMEVTVRFDAYPNTTWNGKIETIHPKSMIRDNRNVFIAELEFTNPEGRLRPGMQGKAKIDAGMKPLGWILFRKPWYTLLWLKDFLF
ncbi:MAG: efflux RND transporter periplasmic adaptor subunit [Deltaproteobacteria bacterium]|nr:efflux RND transporter periplasmic adaptor subunit [Deltaproteobacteria bacterium]